MRELAKALERLTLTAREGKTTPADQQGGTITITNIGVFGMDAGTPIINPGESAILCFGAVRKQPWVVTTDGVDEIVPWQASRSVSRWDAAKAVKGVARWQSIVREAAKQAHRAWVPTVTSPVATPVLVARAGTDRVLVLDPTASTPLAQLEIAPGDERDLVLVVGPEGGIDPSSTRCPPRAPSSSVSATPCSAPPRRGRRPWPCSTRASGAGRRAQRARSTSGRRCPGGDLHSGGLYGPTRPPECRSPPECAPTRAGEPAT